MNPFVRALGLALFGIAMTGSAPAAEPIYIGLVDEVTGPQAEAGILTMNGVKLAVDEVNAAGGIMGRPIELRVEDNASTNPGTVLGVFQARGPGRRRRGDRTAAQHPGPGCFAHDRQGRAYRRSSAAATRASRA